MKGSSGILLIAVGLVMLYVVLSDKYQCFTSFIDCMTGADMRTPEGYTQGTPQTTPGVKSPTTFPSLFPGIFNPDGSIKTPPFMHP